MATQVILVSDKDFDVEKTRDFSRKNGYSFSVYTPDEWSGRSDEVFLFHNEDHSVKTESLPSGHRPVFSLEEIEAYTIEKVLSLCDGNTSQAARLLRIGRATLYRKIGKLGLQLKNIRRLKKDRMIQKDNVHELPLRNGKMPIKKAV